MNKMHRFFYSDEYRIGMLQFLLEEARGPATTAHDPANGDPSSQDGSFGQERCRQTSTRLLALGYLFSQESFQLSTL